MNGMQSLLKQLTPAQQQWGLVLLGVLLLGGLVTGFGQWQSQIERQHRQAQQTHQQLSSLVQGLPATGAIALQGDALLQRIASEPLPGLSGKISNLRLVGQKVSAKVEQAPASALVAWLAQLEQSGVLISAMTLSQPTPGMVSGVLTWGQD